MIFKEEKGISNIFYLNMNEPLLEKIIIKVVNQINKKEIENIIDDLLTYL